MLFKAEDLRVSAVNEAVGILNEACYVENSLMGFNTVPVVTDENLGAHVVRFADIDALSEEFGMNYIDTMIAVAEANDIDAASLAVAVDEAQIIETPEVVGALQNVVVKPISENSLAYRYVAACCESFEGDELFYALIEAYTGYKPVKSPNITTLDSVKPTDNLPKEEPKVTVPNQPEEVKNAKKAEDESKGIWADIKANIHKGRTWIAERIASLRNIYAKYMEKSRSISDPGIANKFKAVGQTILKAIDWLLKKMENNTKPGEAKA